MSETNRSSLWRQGDIFVLRDGEADDVTGIVASHDCDVCATNDVEPSVEFLPVCLIPDVGGQFSFAKSPRKLHCRTLTDDGEPGAVEMQIRDRDAVDKLRFLQFASPMGINLFDDDRVVFRNWLAARYARSAFPNAFEDRLAAKVRKKVDRLSEKSGALIRGIYFDLDDGQMLERELDDVYMLRIHVVYDTETDEDGEASDFADELGKAFKAAFYDDESHEWHEVAVLSCEATSSWEFPLALANAMKPWRVDHRSYQALPTATFPEPAR
jgi:hypothetical protein